MLASDKFIVLLVCVKLSRVCLLNPKEIQGRSCLWGCTFGRSDSREEEEKKVGRLFKCLFKKMQGKVFFADRRSVTSVVTARESMHVMKMLLETLRCQRPKWCCHWIDENLNMNRVVFMNCWTPGLRCIELHSSWDKFEYSVSYTEIFTLF